MNKLRAIQEKYELFKNLFERQKQPLRTMMVEIQADMNSGGDRVIGEAKLVPIRKRLADFESKEKEALQRVGQQVLAQQVLVSDLQRQVTGELQRNEAQKKEKTHRVKVLKEALGCLESGILG